MNNYYKPEIKLDEDLAEGVYAASGTDGISYTVNVHPTHTDKHDGPDWRFDVNATRTGTSSAIGQQVVITFSVPVTIVDKNKAESVTGSGTNMLTLIYRAHKANGEMMLGHITVNSPTQPTVLTASCSEYLS